MYRLTLLVIFTCIVSVIYVQELAGQPAAEQATTEKSTAEPVYAVPPRNALAGRLLDHAVASRLGLNDTQRAEVARLVNLQVVEISNAKTANAPAERYEEIYKQTEEKLANVLTATQRSVLDKGLDDKTIRMVFHHQPWKDVLQYFADQVGCQLVMDAPPPGTFNYADREERTMTEALDLINGILYTKGYTLVRNDRILHLLNLTRPIPNQVFPRVKPEELAGRGSFEFVSVIFPLERRNQDHVIQGIEPIKGLFAKVHPMPENNLLVIDTVENLNAIQKIINSVKNPPAPSQPPQPPPPPTWETYTIEKNDPEVVEAIFKEFVPSSKDQMFRLANSRELRVLVSSQDHAKLKEIFNMLEADAAAGRKDDVVIKAYPIAQYLDSAQSLALDWRLERYRRRSIEGGQPLGADPNSPNWMPLSRTQMVGLEIIAVLKKAFPLAVVSDASVADKIVVLTSAAEQEKVNEFFESLHPSKENQPAIKLYRYTEPGKKMTETTRQQLQALVPNAILTLDEEQGQILVVATEKEQETLAKAVSEFEAATLPSQDKELQVYRLSSSTLTSFWTMVYQLSVQDKLKGYYQIRDTQRNQLLIWATAGQHELIQKVYQEVTGQSQQTDDVPVADVVMIFSPKNITLDTLTTIVEDVYPTAKITTDVQRGQLIIRIRPEQKEPLQSLLKELDADDPDKEKRYFKPYPIESGFYSLKSNWSPYTPVQFIAELEKLAPGAKISFDAQSQSLIVWGTEEEHKIIEAAIQHLIGDGKEKKIMRIQLRRLQGTGVMAILRRMFPTVETTYDYTERGTVSAVIVEGHPKLLPKVKELIELLDPEEPSERDPIVMFYQLDTASSPTAISTALQGLRQLVPTANIVHDPVNKQIMVIARPADQKIIETNTKLIIASFTAPEKEVRRIPLHRFYYYYATLIIQRKYPEVLVTYDYAQGLILEGDPVLLTKVEELLALIDPEKPTENDPVVMFYQLNSAYSPTVISTVISSLKQLVPTANIVPDPDNKQIMVIAKPSDQEMIKTNTELIVSTFAPEEPVLCIYTVTREERTQLESFIQIAATELKGAKIVPEKTPVRPVTEPAVPPNRVSIWAKPSEHELIAAVLKQIQESQTNVPDRQLKSFAMSIGDLKTAQDILKVSHPDAMIFPDIGGNRLMVWATPEELEKITETLRIQGSIDDRAMVVYLVAGVKPETMKKAILEVFQGLKITDESSSRKDEPQNRKLLIWASPDEHVKIAEIVEQANKEVDPDSELAEKFVAYSTANLDAAMVWRLFQAIVPEANVYATQGDDKIVVRALARDHHRIKELFKQLREKDETVRPRLEVYTFGETDPMMIEVMLRNQLPNAESMSPDDLIQRISWTFYMERYLSRNPNYSNRMAPTPKKIGYFRVDPQTQSVQVFVTGEQHKEVKEAMDQLVAAGNQEGFKPILRRYALDEIEDFFDIFDLVAKVAPSALIQRIYARVQRPGSTSWYWEVREFLAYTHESEHEKLESLVKELNDKTGVGRKEMLSLALPEKSPYSREKIIETIQRVFPDITPMPGGTPSHILVWAPKHRLEQIQQIVDDIAQPLPEGERTVLKAYPLQYISVAEATDWLSALYPNISFDPAKMAAAVQVDRGARGVRNLDEGVLNRRYQRPDDAKFIVVVATPLEHAEIEKTIRELDQDLPENYKLVPRTYTLDDIPADSFYRFFGSIMRAFPNTVVTPSAERMTVMVVATEDDQKRVADFIAAYREDNERRRPSLEIYVLKRHNYYRVYSLIQRIAPATFITAGSKPDQIAVWGTPKEHADVAEALMQLETASNNTPLQNLKVYKTGSQKAEITRIILTYSFPGSLIFTTSPNEILVWSSDVDHESIAAMLGTVAEVFPEPILKPYYFKHVPLDEGANILGQAFTGQATLTPRPSTGDLLVFASPDVHEKIATSIANFDVPRPAETEEFPCAYNISDIPAGLLWNVASEIQVALKYRVRALPSVIPGQLIVWGKQADQQKVKVMVDQMLNEAPETKSTMHVYTIQRGNAASIVSLIREMTPRAKIDSGTSQNQILVWTKESDHIKIKEVIDKINESDADVCMKVYYFKHVPLSEGWPMLYYAFSGSATLTLRYSTGDILAFAAPDVHEKIAATIKEFDVPGPVETEMLPRAYDLSALPAGTFWNVYSQIQPALGYRIQVLPSAVPGQLIVWGKQADQEKVKMMIDQMISERPETTATMKAYTLQRVNASSVVPLLQTVAPNIQAYTGTSPNQLLVVATEPNHLKIKEIVDSLNETGSEIEVATYSLKNIDTYSANTVLDYVIQGQGLDIRMYADNFGNQLVVLAKPENQKIVADVLENLRTEDRDLLIVTLENIDPYSAWYAIATMFFDEPLPSKPGIRIDSNANMLFVQGTQKQLERVRKMLRDMGEHVPEPTESGNELRTPPGSNVRVIQLRGGSPEMLRELEKLWKQSQPNQLRIIRENETPPLYSLENEIQRESQQADEESTVNADLFPSIAPVYVIVNNDDSLTVSSSDTAALDRLASILERLSNGIVFEGRDYTIFSIRNTSADVVVSRLQMVLWQQIQRLQLTITPDIAASTIHVRGSKVWRREVAKLLVLFDVSELPGERMVRKPISVPILNTQANRVQTQIMRVYQQKLWMTRLPGGVFPQIIVDYLKNSLEIIAPEPLASELKEYAEEIDRKVLEEPGRKIHVIPLNVKASVIKNAIEQIRQPSFGVQ